MGQEAAECTREALPAWVITEEVPWFPWLAKDGGREAGLPVRDCRKHLGRKQERQPGRG